MKNANQRIRVSENYLISVGGSYEEYIKPYEKGFKDFINSEQEQEHRDMIVDKYGKIEKDEVEILAYITLNCARGLLGTFIRHKKIETMEAYFHELREYAFCCARSNSGFEDGYHVIPVIDDDEDVIRLFPTEFKDFGDLLGKLEGKSSYVFLVDFNLTGRMINYEAIRIASKGMLEKGLSEKMVKSFKDVAVVGKLGSLRNK